MEKTGKYQKYSRKTEFPSYCHSKKSKSQHNETKMPYKGFPKTNLNVFFSQVCDNTILLCKKKPNK